MTKQNTQTIPITSFSKNCLKLAIRSGWQLVGEKNGIFSLVVNANDPAQIISGPEHAKKLRVLTIDSRMSGMEFMAMSKIGVEMKKSFLENLTSPLTQNKDEFSAKSQKLIEQAKENMLEGDLNGAERLLEMAAAPRFDLSSKAQAGLSQLEAFAPKTIEQEIADVSKKRATTKKVAPVAEKGL